MKKVKFYTLLYIDTENQSLSHNGVSGNFDQQMKIFIKCCEVLNKSLLFFTDYELNVITNNKTYIENISKELKCIEIDFDLKVPRDIKFFSAHHKIDVLKYFAQLDYSEYSFLIDSDVLCINNIPLNLINCVKNNIPVYYDITDQVYPRYGREIIIRDKEVLMPNNLSNGMWAGGEFVGGDNIFFKLLYDEIKLIQKDYFENYKTLHHQGDEMLLSVAFEKILQNKYICNVGSFGGIRRYWSGQVAHPQGKWKYYMNDFLIHLPADKKFLAKVSSIDKNIKKRYKNYLNRIFPLVFVKSIVKFIFKK